MTPPSKWPPIEAADVKLLWDCDPERGLLKWRCEKHKKCRGWTSGTRMKGLKKYCVIRYDRRSYFVHRLIWAWVYGRWPTGVIDHKNRDGYDNSIGNLREVTSSVNLVNKPPLKNSRSQIKGVKKIYRRYHAFLDRKGQKRKHLGTFPSAQSAYEARLAAEREYYGIVLSEIADD